MEVLDHALFRVTRDTDYDVSDETDDLLQAVEEELRRRRFGEVVRLEIDAGMSERLRDQLIAALGVADDEVYEVDGLLDLADLWDVVGLSRPRRPPRPAVHPGHPAAAAARPGGQGERPVRRDPRRRHPRPPSLRLVHDHGRALRQAGGLRSRRARDQADRVPDQRRLAAGPGPDRGRRARQAGGLPGGAEGALRRERQHPLGEEARGGGRPRRLRDPGAEDARQVRARRPPRGRRRAPLRPHRHRQLQPEDRPHLHRPRPVHRRPRDRRRHRRDVQLAHRLRAPAQLPQGAGGAVQPPEGDPRRRSSGRSTSHSPETPGADPAEDELAARRALDPGALPRLAGRGRGARSTCAGSARCARACPGVSDNIDGDARSSGASSSTRGSTRSSATASRRASTSAPPT